jgi:ABC-2 type transport system ATP-binding protein
MDDENKEELTMNDYLMNELEPEITRERREQAQATHADLNGGSRQPPGSDSSAVVWVRGLRKTYPGGVEALRGISFDVHEGEIFGMLGPNGAGKTTTIGILTTTVRPSSGYAVVAGHDVVRYPLAVRRAIGVAFQESVLDNEFSGLDNLRLHARLWRVPSATADERIDGLLEAMDLTQRARDGVRTYSGGMRRRLEIARALLSNPRVLFLDEPTLGLDPAVRQDIWESIEQLRLRSGVTVVLSTHYLEEAERVCDRVAIIHQGRMIALDTPKALLRSLGEEAVELKVEEDPGSVLQVLAGMGLNGSSPLVMGKTITIPLTDGATEAARLMAEIRGSGLTAAAMGTRRTTLNDAFLRLTGAGVNGQNGS